MLVLVYMNYENIDVILEINQRLNESTDRFIESINEMIENFDGY